jgi:glycosyltransferase involved in cell wall biosynthesis
VRILHTAEFYAPSLGGVQEVVRQLSEALVKRGHEVCVATTRLKERGFSELKGVRIESFDVSGNLALGLRGEVERYRQFVAQGRFDVIMNYAAQQWATDALLETLRDIPGRKVLVPCGFSGLYRGDYAGYFEKMPRWMQSYDACVFLSETYRDARFAQEHGVTNTCLIPNGASGEEFDPPPPTQARAGLGVAADEFMVLTVGSHTDLKGHREAVRMFRNASLGKAVLVIVGNRIRGGCTRHCRLQASWSKVSPFWRRRRQRVLSLELDRADTVAAYQCADLFLFPSNVECSPLVLFEACAAGLPFLSSPAGNSEEIAAWTGGGRILPASMDATANVRCDIQGGARMLEALASDSALRASLGQSGKRAWNERFRWDKLAGEYERLYLRLLGQGS